MSNIFICDGQDYKRLSHINKKYVLFNSHEQSLETSEDVFAMEVIGGLPYGEYLNERNILIIPGEDGEHLEYRIADSIQGTRGELLVTEVLSKATFLDLKKKKVFDPVKTSSITAKEHANKALEGTGWQLGTVDFSGSRTLTFENPFNPYDYLKRVSSEFELEMRFYVTTDELGVTGRYVDLIDRIGEFRGRTITFGRDLENIRRIENTDDIVTALWAYGPEKDGKRLKAFVADQDALQRWGERGKNGELYHIVDIYEPQSNDQDMTLDDLKRYARTELNKRINASVKFEADIVDLEHAPGLENKKIRFADTIQIKYEGFKPPLYVKARIYKQTRDVFVKDSKKVELGDFTEYTEEEVNAVWRSLQNEIRNRLSKLLVTTIVSSAGNTFKNGVGSTELSATVFLTGNETDKDGTLYDYKWSKRDKGGNLTSYEANGKTITVNAEDIGEKATYIVDVTQDGHTLSLGTITISNVFDGKRGLPGPKGDDGQTLYTWVKYADTPTSGMSDNPTDKEYIGLAYNKTSPNESSNYADYQWAKVRGDRGVQGPPGDDGKPNYTWVKYADDKDGSGISDDSDGKRYLGLAYNKTTPNESNNPSDYNWSPLYDNVKPGIRNYILDSDNYITNQPDSYSLSASDDIINAINESESITVSVDVEIENAQPAGNNRIGYELGINYADNTTDTLHVWVRPDEGQNIKERFSRTQKITKKVVAIRHHGIYIQTTGDLTRVGRPKLEKGNVATDWTPAPEDDRAYAEYVAKLEAEAEREKAEAYADGVVTAEEKARIADAEAKLEQAKQHANDVSNEAENNAKTHADKVSQAKANLAETRAKAHADGIVTAEEEARIRDAEEKLRQAKQHADTKADEAKEGAKTDVESGTVNLPGGSIVDTISGDHLDIDLNLVGGLPQYMSTGLVNVGQWTGPTIHSTDQPYNKWYIVDFIYFRPTKRYLRITGAVTRFADGPNIGGREACYVNVRVRRSTTVLDAKRYFNEGEEDPFEFKIDISDAPDSLYYVEIMCEKYRGPGESLMAIRLIHRHLVD